MALLNKEELEKAQKDIVELCKTIRDSTKIGEYQPNVVWGEKTIDSL